MNAIGGESKERPMAHCGDGGAPPCGCWNACGRRIDGSHAYGSSALTAGLRARVAARLITVGMIERRSLELQLIMKVRCYPNAAREPLSCPSVSHGLPLYSQGLS